MLFNDLGALYPGHKYIVNLHNNFSYDEYRFGGEFSILDVLSLRGGLTISHDPEPFGEDGIQGTDDDADDDEFEYQSEEFIWGPTFGFGLNPKTSTNLNISISLPRSKKQKLYSQYPCNVPCVMSDVQCVMCNCNAGYAICNMRYAICNM